MEKPIRTLETRWFALVVIACAAFAIYSNTWHSPFVFDDIYAIKDNKQIRDLSNFSFPGDFVKARSVVNFTFALNYQFGKLNVFGYHLVNILIHCANGFLVYLLSMALLGRLLGTPGEKNPSKPEERPAAGTSRKKRKKIKAPGTTENKIISNDVLLFPARIIALFAALIFLAHPIQSQAVTYISQRYTSLAAFFYMGSVFFYLKARTSFQNVVPSSFFTLRHLFFLASFLFGILAFVTKQNTASLPLAIVLIEIIVIGGSRRELFRRFLVAVPAFVLFFGFIIYAVNISSGASIGDLLEDVSRISRETTSVSRWNYLCTQFSVLVIYLRLIIFPVGQNLDYYYVFKTGFWDGLTPLAFLFLLGLVILGISKSKRCPFFTFAVFWFFVTLSVESSIIPISDALFEHRLYLPLFGFALLAAWIPFRFLTGRFLLAVFICLLMVISLGTATYFRNKVWQDELTLWSDVIKKSPLSPRAALNLANALGYRKRYDEAINLYNRILRSNPEKDDVLNNMAIAYQKQGKTERAVSYFRRVLEINPNYADAHSHLGDIRVKQRDFEGAIQHYSEASRINPTDAQALSILGVLLADQNELDRALDYSGRAVRIDPQNANVLNNSGLVLEKKEDFNAAARRFAEAIAIDADNSQIRTNLSRVLQQAGDPALAERCYQKILRSVPGNTDFLTDFGVILSRLGDFEGAIKQFGEAVRTDPRDPKAHYNLGLALSKQGKMIEAAKSYSDSLRIQPQNHKAHYNLALTLYGSGDFTGAVQHFEEAMRQEPALKAQASYDIARAYAREGNIEKSEQWLKRAVDAGFNDRDRLKADEDLKNLKDNPFYRKMISGKHQ